MSMEEETLIAKEVFRLSDELDFVVAALNLCRDHMHLLVYCEEDEVPKIMHRVKGRTARACNAYRATKGINPLDATNGKYEPRTLKDKINPFLDTEVSLSSDSQFGSITKHHLLYSQ